MKKSELEKIFLEKDITILSEYAIVEKIARKLLFNLFCRGNNNAYDIYTGANNGLVVLDDITQEMYLYLLEHTDSWHVGYKFTSIHEDNEYMLVFDDEDIAKGFYRIPSTILYQNIRKHDRKKLWIEIDGEEMKIDDISAIASHVCIDDVITLSLYNQFESWLLMVKPKKAHLYSAFINWRLQGCKILQCAEVMHITNSQGFLISKELKILWKKFNKEGKNNERY